jgi:hypothetical protein
MEEMRESPQIYHRSGSSREETKKKLRIQLRV